MAISRIPTAQLRPDQLPSDTAGPADLVEFAHTFDGYERWGSFERCAEIANARDHSSIDALRTCLFFEARRWRHFGEEPDDEALSYWRTLVLTIRERLGRIDTLTVGWLAEAIRQLPSDAPVSPGTQGYNRYVTQKDHWLGWLNPKAGTGTYPRRTSETAVAGAVFNRIGEPKMLLWLIEASDVDSELVAIAIEFQRIAVSLGSKCAALRKAVPWPVVADALLSREQRDTAKHVSQRQVD